MLFIFSKLFYIELTLINKLYYGRKNFKIL